VTTVTKGSKVEGLQTDQHQLLLQALGKCVCRCADYVSERADNDRPSLHRLV
jgi:hypothetical protein